MCFAAMSQTVVVSWSTCSQYYGLPVMSYRGAFWHEVTGRTAITPNGWIDITQFDLVHPNDRGHRYVLSTCPLAWYSDLVGHYE